MQLNNTNVIFGELIYISEIRLINFTIGLANQQPTSDPLASPFRLCATHGRLVGSNPQCVQDSPVPVPGASVTLSCTPTYARGRYLFIAAHVDTYFHLSEVQVFDGRLTRSFELFGEEENNKINDLDSARYVAPTIRAVASGSAGKVSFSDNHKYV